MDLEGRPKKSLGQHFLVDPAAIRRIVETGVAASLPVVEIGPGRGALTDHLRPRVEKLVLVEKDRALAALHREATPSNLVLEADALDVDEDALGLAGPYAVVSNLPYNAAGRITMHIAEAWPKAVRLTLMYQLEVARRIGAGPGSGDFGALTVLVQNRFQVLPIFDLPPGAFRPAPKVWSSVALLLRRPTPLTGALDAKRLSAIVHAAFNTRRKVIGNALRPLIDEPTALLERAGIDPRLRPEDVPVDGWVALLRAESDVVAASSTPSATPSSSSS